MFEKRLFVPAINCCARDCSLLLVLMAFSPPFRGLAERLLDPPAFSPCLSGRGVKTWRYFFCQALFRWGRVGDTTRTTTPARGKTILATKQVVLGQKQTCFRANTTVFRQNH